METKQTPAHKEPISEEEADQYRYDMLAEVVSLPTQDQVELTEEMLDTNFWPELYAANFTVYRYAVNGKTCPTLRDYLAVLQAPPGKMTSVSDVETYYFVSLRFGFRPNVSAKTNLLGIAMQRDETYSDKGLDVGFVDELVKEHFKKLLVFQEIGLRSATIDKFEKAGIVTVGDFIMQASIERMRDRYGISSGPLRTVADFIEKEYGINRKDFKSHVPLRETMKIRYAVILASQDETE